VSALPVLVSVPNSLSLFSVLMQLCNDREALLGAIGCTLLAVQAARLCVGDIAAATDAALHQLIDRQLVTEKKPRLDHASKLRNSGPTDDAQLSVTELGRAACKGELHATE